MLSLSEVKNKQISIFLICFVYLFQNYFYAQAPGVDSLNTAFKNAKHDTTRCDILSALVDAVQDESKWPLYNEELKKLCEKNLKVISATHPLYFFYSKYLSSTINNVGFIYDNEGDYVKAMEFYDKSLRISEKITDKEGMARSLLNIGTILQEQGDNDGAIKNLTKAIDLQKEVNDKLGMAYSLINLGRIYNFQGNVLKALELYHTSLKIREEIGDKEGIATSLNNIAYVYNHQGDRTKALETYNKVLKIQKEINDQRGISRTLNNISTIYRDNGEIAKALEYLQTALKINTDLKDKKGIAFCLSNLAFIYKHDSDSLCAGSDKDCRKKNLSTALDCYLGALKIYEESGEKKGMASCFTNIAVVKEKQTLLSEAEKYGRKGLALSKELGYPEMISGSAMVLKVIYKKLNKHKEAYEMYGLHIQMRDSIANETTRKSSVKKQFQIEYEREAIKDSIANVAKMSEEQLKHEAAITQQRTYTYGGFAGLGLMLVVAGVSFKAYRNKQKANVIITEQKQVAEMQKHVIEEKQKEIIDSINYARKIQRAHLPNENYVARKMSELISKSKP